MLKSLNNGCIKHRETALLFLMLLFAGCKPLITFEYLDINCSIGEKQDYFADEKIKISFSCMPDTNDVQKKIHLYEDSGIVSADFEWAGSIIYIYPHKPWQKGQFYTLDLHGTLKMLDGRTYTAELFRTFIYGSTDNDFELSSHEFNQNLLSLDFSKPVSIDSFLEKFYLSPFADYRIDFSADNCTAIVSPKNGWAVNTAYTWTVKNMISADGYLMNKEYSGLFTGVYDTKQATLEFVCPVDYSNSGSIWYTQYQLDNHLLENQSIGFSFSKPMDETTVSSAISFFPSISGFYVKETESRFVFIPNDNYQICKEYRIIISDTAKDTSGLSLYEPMYIFFTTANQFLAVTEITFDNNTVPVPVDGTIIDYVIKPLILPNDPYTIGTVINFSTAIPREQRHDAVNAISLTVIFPDTANSPLPFSAYWSDGGARLTIEWSGFSVSSGDIINYYLLKISGGQNGIKNGANEYLETDVCVIFIAR